MSHFAEIDENNIVIRVLVCDNDDPNGDEGYQWLVTNLGGRWIKTSYNAKIRKHFAGIGFTYNETLDAFIAPKMFDSWVFDESDCVWLPPVPRPEGDYVWDELSQTWLLRTE